MASTSVSTPVPKKIVLITSDKETFEVEEAVAIQSETIKNIIEDDCFQDGIPTPNVTGTILAKALEYCKKHADLDTTDDKSDDEIRNWDAKFADGVKDDQNVLFDLILAANYLNIKGLLDLLCEKVANMMRGKSPEEIRTTFHIKNDYTKEEEEEVRKENMWAFQ